MALFSARGLARGCSLLAIAAVASCCAHPSTPGAAAPNPNLAADLARSVTVDAMMVHLQQLQQVADANGGNRAEGTSGYDASADYVAKVLKDRGFEVQTPELSRLKVLSEGKPLVDIGGRPYALDQASYFAQTPKGGLKANIIRPSGKASGCAAADYGTLKVDGQIAVVDGTGCSVVDKHNVAKQKGASGVLVAMQAGAGEGLFTPNYYEQLSIPVGIIDSGVDTLLRRNSSPVNLVLDMNVAKVRSHSVIAQTATGDPANVVLAGAHLDSVSKGPGINDNGTGVAAVLETALQLGPKPVVNNAVRFAFWTAEEDGLAGARLREEPQSRRAQRHRVVPELRHARLSQCRVLRARWRPIRGQTGSEPAAPGCSGRIRGDRAHLRWIFEPGRQTTRGRRIQRQV